jgi:hypothetical protein
VVCLPKTSGTNYTIAGNDDFEREEDNDSGTKESTYEDSGDDDSEEEDDDESDGKVEAEKEVMQDNNNKTGNNKSSTPVKCSYRRCGAGLFLNDVWTLLPCANSSCKKKIHRLFFEHFLTVANLPFQVKTDTILLRYCSLLLKVLATVWRPYSMGQ